MDFLRNTRNSIKPQPIFPQVERDLALKEQALKNIKTHPAKFALNWISDLGRMIFSYPYSYALQTPKTFFTLIPNMFIVVFSVLSVLLVIRFPRHVRAEVCILLVFATIYLLGSSLLSACGRQFFLILPVLFFWFGIIFDQFIEIGPKTTYGNDFS